MLKQAEKNDIGYYFPLQVCGNKTVSDKYRGCGNGYIVVCKGTGDVIDMAYGLGESVQNVGMCEINGVEVVAESDDTISYRCNFSCYQACLF